MVKAGAGDAEEGRQTGKKQGQVAEPRDRCDKGRVGERGVGDEQWNLQLP